MSRYLDLADQVLGLVGDRGEAEVLVYGGIEALTRFANSFIHQNVGEEQLSVTLKVAVDGRVSSATSTQTDDDALRRLVDATIEAARLRSVDPDWPGLAAPAVVPAVEHYDEATHFASPAERAAVVKAFVDVGPGLKAAGYCGTEGGTVAFVNSAGQRVEGRSTRSTIDGIHQTGTSAGSGHQTAGRLAELDGAAVGSVARRRAVESAEAFDLEPGEYEVVLAPECVATMVVFLCAYGLNAKQVAEGQSFAEVGKQQFDDRVAIWDDATGPGALGVLFDAEGTPKRRVELVTGGVTASLAHDRRTARKLDTESTGHAVPGGETWGAFPTNLFVGVGGETVEEMIAAVERGLYVSTFNYNRVLDPKTQVVTGLTRNGTFMITNGEITGSVTNLRYTQSFVEALGPGRVLGLGSDSRFAASEFGDGLIHTPSVRLASWNFTGGAEG
ncbi:MAG: TldD/PmbA family protein [Acidimicrobiia bacterium]